MSPRIAVPAILLGWFAGWLIKTDSESRIVFLQALGITLLMGIGCALFVALMIAGHWDFWHYIPW